MVAFHSVRKQSPVGPAFPELLTVGGKGTGQGRPGQITVACVNHQTDMAKKAFKTQPQKKQEELVYTADHRIRKVLGAPTYKVYRLLLRVRDPVEHENWMLRRSIGLQTGLKDHHVSKCLTKLTKLGLVIPNGWRSIRMAVTGRFVMTLHRLVLGERDRYGRTFLPASAHAAIMGHKGPGRPAEIGPRKVDPTRSVKLVSVPQLIEKTKDLPVGARALKLIQGATERRRNSNSMLFLKEKPFEKSQSFAFGTWGHASGPRPSASSPKSSPQAVSFFTGEPIPPGNAVERGAAERNEMKTTRACLLSDTSLHENNPSSAAVRGLPTLGSEKKSIGARVGKSAQGGEVPELVVWNFFQKWKILGLRATPMWTLGRVPSPPKGPEELELRAEWLVRMYADYLRQKFGKKFYWRGPISRQPWFKTVIAATRRLQEGDLNGVMWVYWSFSHWGGKGHPGVTWVFSVNRIEKREEWFNQDMDGQCLGGEVIQTPASKEFHRSRKALEDALFELGVATESQVLEVGRRILDPYRYQLLVSLAEFEGKEAVRKLKQDIERGRWVWGV